MHEEDMLEITQNTTNKKDDLVHVSFSIYMRSISQIHLLWHLVTYWSPAWQPLPMYLFKQQCRSQTHTRTMLQTGALTDWAIGTQLAISAFFLWYVLRHLTKKNVSVVTGNVLTYGRNCFLPNSFFRKHINLSNQGIVMILRCLRQPLHNRSI